MTDASRGRESTTSRRRGVRVAAKRGIDVVGSAATLVVSSPLTLVASVLVRASMGPPVLFRQERLGFGGRVFVLYKFRTMTDDRDAYGRLMPDGDRLTRMGRFLRTTTIDELPQFLNVLRGDMSLVGPRPLLVRYRDLYTPEQWRRHDVRPGLTGLAQVRGRNALSWEERFELDVWYANNWSLLLDLRILLLTLTKVIRGEGVSHTGHVTMPEFTGSGEGSAADNPPRR
jgi:sugar transferase EpsL